jgi:hypothetical protein
MLLHEKNSYANAPHCCGAVHCRSYLMLNLVILIVTTVLWSFQRQPEFYGPFDGFIKVKTKWTGHILLRHCLLRQVIEGKIKGGIEVTGRRGRRCRKLLDDLKKRRGYSYLNEEALDRTMWIAHFGRDFGPVVRQTTKWMKNICFRDWEQLFMSKECTSYKKQKTWVCGTEHFPFFQ